MMVTRIKNLKQWIPSASVISWITDVAKCMYKATAKVKKIVRPVSTCSYNPKVRWATSLSMNFLMWSIWCNGKLWATDLKFSNHQQKHSKHDDLAGLVFHKYNTEKNVALWATKTHQKSTSAHNCTTARLLLEKIIMRINNAVPVNKQYIRRTSCSSTRGFLQRSMNIKLDGLWNYYYKKDNRRRYLGANPSSSRAVSAFAIANGKYARDCRRINMIF